MLEAPSLCQIEENFKLLTWHHKQVPNWGLCRVGLRVPWAPQSKSEPGSRETQATGGVKWYCLLWASIKIPFVIIGIISEEKKH